MDAGGGPRGRSRLPGPVGPNDPFWTALHGRMAGPLQRACVDIQGMTTPTAGSERHADLYVACDSCGADTPAAVLSGISVPRARCATCTLAVERALDEVVRQLVARSPEHDSMATAVRTEPTCFDCGAAGGMNAAGTSFTCAACGSHCFSRQAAAAADDALSA